MPPDPPPLAEGAADFLLCNGPHRTFCRITARIPRRATKRRPADEFITVEVCGARITFSARTGLVEAPSGLELAPLERAAHWPAPPFHVPEWADFVLVDGAHRVPGRITGRSAYPRGRGFDELVYVEFDVPGVVVAFFASDGAWLEPARPSTVDEGGPR